MRHRRGVAAEPAPGQAVPTPAAGGVVASAPLNTRAAGRTRPRSAAGVTFLSGRNCDFSIGHRHSENIGAVLVQSRQPTGALHCADRSQTRPLGALLIAEYLAKPRHEGNEALPESTPDMPPPLGPDRLRV
jgi:hypothetical protein